VVFLASIGSWPQVALKAVKLSSRVEVQSLRGSSASEAIAKLAQPDNVTAFDADQTGEVCFFVMEYVRARISQEGGARRSAARGERLSAGFSGGGKGCNTPTSRAWSTATSSRRTCCCESGDVEAARFGLARVLSDVQQGMG